MPPAKQRGPRPDGGVPHPFETVLPSRPESAALPPLRALAGGPAHFRHRKEIESVRGALPALRLTLGPGLRRPLRDMRGGVRGHRPAAPKGGCSPLARAVTRTGAACAPQRLRACSGTGPALLAMSHTLRHVCQYAACRGTTPAKLRIYDPYYCAGNMVRSPECETLLIARPNLGSRASLAPHMLLVFQNVSPPVTPTKKQVAHFRMLGFPCVSNTNTDCYKVAHASPQPANRIPASAYCATSSNVCVSALADLEPRIPSGISVTRPLSALRFGLQARLLCTMC